MYIDTEQEPEFIQRYKIMDRAQFGRRDEYGRRPYPLRDLRKYDVNRFGPHLKMGDPSTFTAKDWEMIRCWGANPMPRLGQLKPNARNLESGIPPWVLWLAIGLLIWFLLRNMK